ncbi:hypothetical protein Cgig2_001905 [Carnegiea gigantea]|uniref:Uncharacterized protein n=1 Tax=Carnegiea gigantea TaxID=171969 RepID=A0A9Q1K7N3_9CARY|nr:hypothetical protein Cgig2_001905 [Carnegiea gigantea]
MIFSTLEYILTHISFSTVSVVITLQLITLLINEIVGLHDSFEKGIIITFFCLTRLLVTHWIYSKHFTLSDLYELLIFLCNNRAKCYFDPRICYFGSLNGNASIRNISIRPPISVVNDACKYDGLGLCSSFMRIIIINSTFNHCISKRYIKKRYNKDF